MCYDNYDNYIEEVILANHKSAEKRIRSSKKRAQTNKRILSSLRKCEKSLRKDLNDKNAKAVEEGLKKLFKLSDKAKTGVLSRKMGLVVENPDSLQKL